MSMLEVEKLQQLSGHKGSIYTLTQLPNGILSAGSDKLLALWTPLETTDAQLLATTTGIVYSSLYQQAPNHVVLGLYNGQIQIIDLSTKQEFKCLQLGNGGVFSLVQHPTKQLLYASTADGWLYVLSALDYTVVCRLQLGAIKIRQVAVSPYHDVLYVACGDGSVRTYNTETLAPLNQFLAHDWNVNCITFHPSLPYILTGSRDAHVKVWTLEHELVLDLPAHNYAIYQLAFSPNGQYLATVSRDKSIKLFEASTFKFLTKITAQTHQGHINSVNTLLWLNDTHFISGSDDRSLIVWKIKPLS